MSPSAPRKAACAGCRAMVSEDGPYMKCAKCKQIYDIICANIDAVTFGTLSVEFRKSWVCVECRSKLPKSDNSHTPVRQHHIQDMRATNIHPDNRIDSPDNVTLRTTARMAHSQNTEQKDTRILQDMKDSVLYELKKMQVDFETQLTSKINNLIVEQFLAFKSEFLDKINILTRKILDIEKHYKYSKDNIPEPLLTSKNPRTTTSETKVVPKRKPQENSMHVETRATSGGTSPPLTPKVILQKTPPTSDPASCKPKCDDTDSGSWEEVKRKRSKASLPGVLRGTAAPGSTLLRASQRWSYLHLYYVQEGTTAEEVRNYLKTICGDDVCTVDVLKSRGRYASFKLGVPLKYAEKIMSSENWAEDICVKPWRQNFRPKTKKQM